MQVRAAVSIGRAGRLIAQAINEAKGAGAQPDELSALADAHAAIRHATEAMAAAEYAKSTDLLPL